MQKESWKYLLLTIAALIIAACQTAKPLPDPLAGNASIIPVEDLPASQDKISIEARRKGFSPTSVSVKNSLDLLLSFGKRDFVKSWTVAVISPTASLKREFKGTSASMPEYVIWDGKYQSGKPAAEGNYYALLSVDYGDAFNPVSAKSPAFAIVTIAPKGSLSIDILVIKTDRGYRIRIASIVFKAFTADFVNVLPDRAKRNQATLGLLAKKLAKFPDYGIAIVGHAVMINWDDAAAGKAEQESILLPLSREQAVAIKAALGHIEKYAGRI